MMFPGMGGPPPPPETESERKRREAIEKFHKVLHYGTRFGTPVIIAFSFLYEAIAVAAVDKQPPPQHASQ